MLTAKGIATLGQYGKVQDGQQLRHVFDVLTDEEKQQLIGLLKKINEALRKESTNEKR